MSDGIVAIHQLRGHRVHVYLPSDDVAAKVCSARIGKLGGCQKAVNFFIDDNVCVFCFTDPGGLRFVVKALYDVGEHWQRVGKDFKVNNLEKIRQDYRAASLCLIVMADSLLRGKRMKSPGRPANWREIVRVIHRTNSVHAKHVAGNLDG